MGVQKLLSFWREGFVVNEVNLSKINQGSKNLVFT